MKIFLVWKSLVPTSHFLKVQQDSTSTKKYVRQLLLTGDVSSQTKARFVNQRSHLTKKIPQVTLNKEISSIK